MYFKIYYIIHLSKVVGIHMLLIALPCMEQAQMQTNNTLTLESSSLRCQIYLRNRLQHF